jgi:hypothetical protein
MVHEKAKIRTTEGPSEFSFDACTIYFWPSCTANFSKDFFEKKRCKIKELVHGIFMRKTMLRNQKTFLWEFFEKKISK